MAKIQEDSESTNGSLSTCSEVILNSETNFNFDYDCDFEKDNMNENCYVNDNPSPITMLKEKNLK